MSTKEGVCVAAEEAKTPLLRTIEFQLAKKSYSCFSNTSDFKLETLNPSTASNLPLSLLPSSSKKPEVSDFIDGVLDPDIGLRISYQRIGAGLENLGNTCFLNSVLQCLTYTEPLAAYLQSGKHQTSCHVAGFCALCAIQRHVSRALQSSGRIVAPKDLVSNLRCISRNFRNARQEDAHEYMIHLLESMHKCCLPSGVPAQSSSAYERSLVHKIFGGRLRSQVKCLQCSHCSNTFDPFLDLSLEIVKADSLHKALINFTAAEQLDDGERQYKCEKCKHKVRALKQLTISKPPYVLTIHLKRFRSHFGGQKIDKKVHFGSALDLKPFVSGAYEGDLTYTLYGVLVHAGWSTHSGHYYCYVRTSSGLWYRLDDNRVIQVSEKIVLEQKAYMLFYVRDRKTFLTKKAMDIVHKESMITAIQNTPSSICTPIIKGLQNGCTLRSSSESSKTFGSIVTSEKVSNLKRTDISSSEPLLKSPEAAAVAVTADNDGKVQHQATVAVAVTASSTKPSLSLQRSTDGDGGNITSHVVNVVADTKHKEAPPCGENDCKLEKIDPSELTAQLKSESEICKEETKTTTSDINPAVMKSKLKKPITSASSKVSGPISRQKLKKKSLKKKSLKTRVGMHLSTMLLYEASLNLVKRRKCKRRKQNKKEVLHENLVAENPISIEMGPTTSNKKLEVAVVGEKPQENGSTKKASYIGDGVCINSQQQNGVVSTATLLLQETTVARWEGVDTSGIAKSKSGGTVSIGYVPDEWDEEYDRGKRKKIRGPKLEFGGPNRFQEIATAKAKRRKRN